MLNIVLHQPEIPANTGNIGRTCVATGTRLHLIEPLGFRLNEKQIKRAGMDYWKDLDVTTYVNYQEFLEKNEKLRKEGTGACGVIMPSNSREYLILTMGSAIKDAEQIQFNVVDNEVLKEAQKRPEDFPDLMVRVSGYSALFTSLGVACQNDVINRTEVEM